MNSNHLPAGRGAHGGPPMNGTNGMNGHPGNGNAGRGGGSRRGRNYNVGGNAGNFGNITGNYNPNANYNPNPNANANPNTNGNFNNGRHNNGQHTNGHNQNGHNGHFNQYPNQGYPGYANGYQAPANNYGHMGYMQGNGMANGYVNYPQQGYGRGAPANGQYAPMGSPMGMPLGMQQFVPSQAHHMPQAPPPQQFPGHPQAHHPQHMPPHNNNYPRGAPPPMMPSSHTHQMPLPPAGRYPSGPVNGFPPYVHVPNGPNGPNVPTGPNGLPPTLPPHNPPPAPGYNPQQGKVVASKIQSAAAPEFIPRQQPQSPASTNAVPTPASSQPSDKQLSPSAPCVIFSSEPSVAPSVAASDVSVVATFGDIVVEESSLFVPAVSQDTNDGKDVKDVNDTNNTAVVFIGEIKLTRQPQLQKKIQPEWSSHPDDQFPSKRKARRNKKLNAEKTVDMPKAPAESAESKPVKSEPVEPTKPSEPAQSASTEPAPAHQTPKPTFAQVTSSPPSAPAALAPAPKGTSPVVVPALPILPIRTAPAANVSPKAKASAPAKKEEKTAPTSATAPLPAGKENIQPAKIEDAKADATSPASPATPVTPASPTPAPVVPAAPLAPMSWAKRAALNVAAAPAANTANGAPATNGDAADGTSDAAAVPKTHNNALAEVIANFQVRKSGPVAFIEPRGLTNSGNMCYMLAVLQGLTFCTPFYDFLDQVGKNAVHSFKSETPMLDAMIMYIREFKVLARAEPAALRQNLKKADYDAHGRPFTPDFVYHATKEIPRFASMTYGHQQDAEEFLGFLLESLNDECTAAVRNSTSRPSSSAGSSGSATPNDTSDGWLEVGHRQKTAVMQSSGHSSASPINSIFVSQLRSELTAPGRQASVTVEPYQTLQLHIDSPDVHNIGDALRLMTASEKVRVDGPSGDKVDGSKRLHIQTLPPVLILHLKRFQFDSGTIKKISKKVGYPLQLDIPRELLSHGKSDPAPKYRLNAVVYHHGKHANGGHYTVDVLRSDESDWIRVDDTSVRRIAKSDVVEAGAKDPAAKTNGATTNGAGWSPVSGNGKQWSKVAGDKAPASKPAQDAVKDNKVAYLLFYQRIN